jgi:hypothetical protein
LAFFVVVLLLLLLMMMMMMMMMMMRVAVVHSTVQLAYACTCCYLCAVLLLLFPGYAVQG